MRARSAANSADPRRPSPDFTSSTMSSASCGSRGQHVGECRVELGDLGSPTREPRPRTTRRRGRSSRAFRRSPRADSSLWCAATIGGQLRETLAHPAGADHVVVQLRVGQLTLEVGVLGEHCVNRRGRLRHHLPLLECFRCCGLLNGKPTPGLSLKLCDRSGVGRQLVVG